MSNHHQEIGENLHAVIGLGASASASALRNVSQLVQQDNTKTALDEIAILSALSARAQMCLNVAVQAEADGDAELAELGWQHAHNLMDHLARETAALETAVAEDEPHYEQRVIGQAH